MTVGGVGHSPPLVGLGSAGSTFSGCVSSAPLLHFESAPSAVLGGATLLRFATGPSVLGGRAKQRLGSSKSIGEAGTLDRRSTSPMRDASAALRTW